MSECDKCGSERVLTISAKCSDMCSLSFLGKEKHGYVPHDLLIGGGDYIKIDICLDCGKAQGIENVDDPEFYENAEDDEDPDFDDDEGIIDFY